MTVYYVASAAVIFRRILEIAKAGGIPKAWTLWRPRVPFKSKMHLAWCYVRSDLRILKKHCATVRTMKSGFRDKPITPAIQFLVLAWLAGCLGAWPAAAEYREPYRVQVGDVLDIHPEKSSSELYPVLPDGNLYIPALGTDMVLNVLNRTTVEIAKEIRNMQQNEIPVNYVVIVKSRSQSEVRVLGAANVVGEQPADNLIKIIARAGGGTRAWNKKIRVYFSDERKTRTYKMKDILSSDFSAPDIPRESTVVFCEKWTYNVFGSWREVLPWLVFGSGVWFGVSR